MRNRNWILLATARALSMLGCGNDSHGLAQVARQPAATTAGAVASTAVAGMQIASDAGQSAQAGMSAASNAGAAGVSSATITAGAGGASASAGVAAAMGGAGGAPVGPLYLGLAPIDPSQRFQLRSVGADIPPNQEAEYCEVAQLPGKPGEVYWVNDVELGNGKGSHHLVVSVAAPGAEAEKKIQMLKVGDHIACPGATLAFGDTRGSPTRGLSSNLAVAL